VILEDFTRDPHPPSVSHDAYVTGGRTVYTRYRVVTGRPSSGTAIRRLSPRSNAIASSRSIATRTRSSHIHLPRFATRRLAGRPDRP